MYHLFLSTFTHLVFVFCKLDLSYIGDNVYLCVYGGEFWALLIKCMVYDSFILLVDSLLLELNNLKNTTFFMLKH